MKPFRFPRTPLSTALARPRLLACLALSSLTLLTVPPAWAMEDLGDLPGTTSSIWDPVISGNGKVVGGFDLDDPNQTLYLWSADRGFSTLPDSPGNNGRHLAGLSADGSVVAGTGHLNFDDTWMHAFRWSAATGYTDLGTLGGDFSNAAGISDDGNVIVGTSDLAGLHISRAFRWTAGTMTDLGSLTPDGESEANGVSGNGKVTVGSAYTNTDPVEQAVMWDEAGTISRLGIAGAATATNVDGSVTVGRGTQLNGPAYAFRWTAANGAENLGTLGGRSSQAKDVNADGSVVVGGAQQSDGEEHAFRWTQATGMISLGVLSGATSSVATGVSNDGNTIVGTSDLRAFIWTSNTGSDGALQDLEHLQLSQITSANTLSQLMASQSRRMRALNEQPCIATEPQRYCLSSGLSSYRGEAGGDGSQLIGHVTGGLRVNPQFTVGASLSLGQADLKLDDARQTQAYGLALWGTYQQHPDFHGWVGSASAGMGHSRNRFERGVGLTDVQRAQALTDMNSTGVRLALGYGVPVGNSLVTPEVALSRVHTQSDGFTERHVAFPLTLGRASSEQTYATLGVRSETPLTPKATLHLGAAVDALLNDNTDAIEGRSAVPGLNRFQLRSDLNKRELLPMTNAGVSYALSPNASVSGQAQAGAAPHKDEGAVYGVGVQYRYAF